MLEASDHEPDREHKQPHERPDQPSLRPKQPDIAQHEHDRQSPDARRLPERR